MQVSLGCRKKFCLENNIDIFFSSCSSYTARKACLFTVLVALTHMDSCQAELMLLSGAVAFPPHFVQILCFQHFDTVIWPPPERMQWYWW